jgi:hypothetical protein
MNWMVGRRILATCIVYSALTFVLPFAQAAIVIEAEGLLSATSFSIDASGTFSIFYDVQSANTEVLVVGLYVDADPVAGPPTAISNLRFNGALPDETPLNALRSTLAYWSMIPDSGTYQILGDINLDALTSGNGYVWELSNINLSLGVDAAIISGNTSTTGSIATSSSGRLVTNFLGANKQGGTVGPATGSMISAFTSLQFGGPTGGTVAGGAGIAPTMGSHTLGWRNVTGGGTSSWGELAYAFVPEPSSLMLLVGGVLLVAGRRRIVG